MGWGWRWKNFSRLLQHTGRYKSHCGFSIGCPEKSGAAGTYFNADLQSLKVGSDNMTTETETPLLDFPTIILWSNVIVENNAKVLVPLLWSRVQVKGQISLYRGGCITFGLTAFPVSEFELVAEELLMIDSVIKANSIICSNSNLGLYGQGLLRLTGHGDAIKGKRLSLSIFYNITVRSGSLLQAPLDDYTSRTEITKPLCESQSCPIDLITPPDDCHVNYTLSFSLQICCVEDILLSGPIKGSIIHIHRARTIIVGCSEGIGKGNYSNGAGSGAGHGGRGGSGYYNGIVSDGGNKYGNTDLPCELGSGAEGPNSSYENVVGGGLIVMASDL